MQLETPVKQHPSTERVFAAVRELRAQGQIATRETVADLTNLKLSIIDDRLRTLVDDGRCKRLLRGIYELVEQYPAARRVSKTALGDGYVMIEFAGRNGDADVVLHLTPEEDRALAMLSVGAAGQAIMINSTNQHLYLATELAARVEKLERENKALRSQRTDEKQPELDLGY